MEFDKVRMITDKFGEISFATLYFLLNVLP